MFRLFKPKTDQEIQAELKALVNRIEVDQIRMPHLFDKYEALLAEIYKRGLEPDMWLSITSQEERREKQ